MFPFNRDAHDLQFWRFKHIGQYDPSAKSHRSGGVFHFLWKPDRRLLDGRNRKCCGPLRNPVCQRGQSYEPQHGDHRLTIDHSGTGQYLRRERTRDHKYHRCEFERDQHVKCGDSRSRVERWYRHKSIRERPERHWQRLRLELGHHYERLCDLCEHLGDGERSVNLRSGQHHRLELNYGG